MSDANVFSEIELSAAERANIAAGKPVLAPEFQWHGGPILASATVGLVFIGNDDSAFRAQIYQFLQDLVNPAAGWLNILAQYGIKSASIASPMVLTPPNNNLQEKDIWKLVVKAHGMAGADCYLLVLAPGIAADFGGAVLCEPSADNAFGDHSCFYHWLSNLRFAVIPALETPCVQVSCPDGDLTCTLKTTQSRLDRVTQVISHELAEMMTDPQCSPQTTGWSGGSGAWEVADMCAGSSVPMTVSGRTWNVQTLYSKLLDSKGTFPACVGPSPTPLVPVWPMSDFWAHWTNFFIDLYHLVADNVAYWM
jgi:hypothetical protein